MRRAEEIAFVGALVYRFRVLMPLLQEHLDAYDEMIPHLFLGDVTRWIVDRVSGVAAVDPIIHDILAFFEVGFKAGGNSEKELISVSFLENFPLRSERGSDLRGLVGPELKKELEKAG